MRSVFLVSVSAAVGVAATASLLTAGPLAPSSGPVASTYKTLQQVEPRIDVATLPSSTAASFVISQPGSYYLSGNVQGVSGKAGIVIASGGVTLDLNGFTLQGVAGSTDAIGVTVPVSNVIVRNGTIDGWGANGLNLASATASVVVDIVATNCGVAGVHAGPQAIVERCVARGNAVWGFRTGPGAMVSRCSAVGNATVAGGGGGFELGINAIAESCIAMGNGSSVASVGGFRLLQGGVVRNAHLDLNLPVGVLVTAANCTVQDSRISGGSPGAIGIRGSASADCRIEGNSFSSLALAIDAGGMAGLVARNSMRSVQTIITAAGSILYGPSVNSGNIAGATSPHGNFVY